MNEFKKARHAAGLTQLEMSKRMQIPKRTIESWEGDVRHPPQYVKRFLLNELADIAEEVSEKDTSTVENIPKRV